MHTYALLALEHTRHYAHPLRDDEGHHLEFFFLDFFYLSAPFAGTRPFFLFTFFFTLLAYISQLSTSSLESERCVTRKVP